jgi:hypothetical protein
VHDLRGISCLVCVRSQCRICRKREDNIVELRKNKRDENLQKKRMVFAGGHDSGTMEDSTRGGGMQEKVVRFAREGICISFSAFTIADAWPVRLQSDSFN